LIKKVNVMDYTTDEMLDKLGLIINKIQLIRNNLPIGMKCGDARQVALSGIQTIVEPLMLSFGSLEWANQSIPNIELNRLCGIKNRSNDEIIQSFDVFVKLSLLTFTQFKIECLFSDLLLAFNNKYNSKNGFIRKMHDLLSIITLNNKNDKKKVFIAISILRNSLHNNSVNLSNNFNEIIKNKDFCFIKGQPAYSSILDLIFLIDCAIDIIDEILSSPEVLTLQSPIPELFTIAYNK